MMKLDSYNTFLLYLKAKREHLQINQEDIASALNITLVSYSLKENNKNPFLFNEFLSLLDIFKGKEYNSEIIIINNKSIIYNRALNIINHFRKENKLTQTDIANILNIKRFSYAQKERGATPFYAHEIFVILDHFDKTMEDLLYLINNYEEKEISEIDTFLNKIKSIREEKGITQDKISSILNTNQTTYNFIESGKKDLTIDNLFKICKVLEIDPKDLF